VRIHGLCRLEEGDAVYVETCWPLEVSEDGLDDRGGLLEDTVDSTVTTPDSAQISELNSYNMDTIFNHCALREW